MSAHRTRAISLVIATIDLFGREGEAGKLAGEGLSGIEREGEGLSGCEHCRGIRGSMWFSMVDVVMGTS